jgi:nucleotide-binding universal stress UspA family protein
MITAAPSFRAFLVALDESVRAPLVLATATALAKESKAQIFLIRVLTLPPDIPPAARTHPDGLENKVERQVRQELLALMDTVRGVQFGPPIVVEGDPWRRILDVAKQLGVDLIVVGSHRYHGLDHLLGTVAAKVVNHADRNVLVVHERQVSPLLS